MSQGRKFFWKNERAATQLRILFRVAREHVRAEQRRALLPTSRQHMPKHRQGSRRLENPELEARCD
jgi:hypothetical protein